MIALVAACLFASGDRLGLKCDDILRMPPERWMNHYTGKKGKNDPITLGEAAAVYAGCIRERYAPLLRKRPKAERTRLAILEKYAVDFKNACFEVQYMQGGGGTIYSHLQRLTVIDDARLMEDLLQGKGSARLKTESTIEAAWKRADAWVAARVNAGNDQKKALEGSGAAVPDLRRVAREAQSSLKQVKALIQKRPLAERGRVAEYVVEWIAPILGESGKER